MLDSPGIERAEALSCWARKDPADNGRFLVGVLTTGIYCLPTCPARKPKDENVRFLRDEEAARAAGLRPCKRCRPDHFYRDFDPDRELIAALTQRVRARPADFADVRALRRAGGIGATKLNELFRRHVHTSPAAYLQRARLSVAAAELARTKRRVLDIALDAGFESSSAFHEAFRALYAMSSGAYRKMVGAPEFTLVLPANYRRQDAFGILGRDGDGRTERVAGNRATKALLLAGRPARIDLELSPRRARARVTLASGRVTRAMMIEAHARTVRILGLASDPGAFERRMRRVRGMARLVSRRPGLRIPQTADAFEGLVWVIVGQQVNVTFASVCRSRLIELAGTRIGDFITHPDPPAVARLEPEDLTKLQFSRRKAEYLVDVAREIASGRLDLEVLRFALVSGIEEALGAVRGLGPWSIHYLLMRSFGFADCVPVGDVALEAALQRFFDLAERPKAKRTLELMRAFAPHRSLATFHLWKSLGDDA